MRWHLTAAVSDRNALPAEAPGLLLPAMRGQFPVGPYHPPPREAETAGKDVADGPGRARISCAPGNFTVADVLPPPDVPDDRPHRLDKGSLLFDARRAPAPLRPGRSRPGRAESRSGLSFQPAAPSPPTSVTGRAPLDLRGRC